MSDNLGRFGVAAWHRYGSSATLLEVADPDIRRRLECTLAVEHVIGAETVLLRHPGVPSRIALAHLRLRPRDGDCAAEPPVIIPVQYRGADLAAVAARSQLTVAEVIHRHTAPTYVAAFCGFAPGFAYLTGLDPALHGPRLASPRSQVPAGSVAIAGQYSAVYPTASPGGWQLLGTTDVPLFDPQRTPPAVLRTGRRLRFEARS